MKTFLQQNNVDLFGLSDKPESASAAQQRRWLELNAKAKSTITSTLCDGPLAQVSAIVGDDDKTAKDLWLELDNAYRISNNQIVINIQRKLETMTID